MSGCVRSDQSSRAQEIGLPPVATPTERGTVDPVSIVALSSEIDTAAAWAAAFPGLQLAIVRSQFEEWEGIGFVRVIELKNVLEERGELVLRVPAMLNLVDAQQDHELSNARARGVQDATFNRVDAAEGIWSRSTEQWEVTADCTVGDFGDPQRESRLLLVLWARLHEVTEGGGHHGGWLEEPYNGDSRMWLRDANRRFNTRDTVGQVAH